MSKPQKHYIKKYTHTHTKINVSYIPKRVISTNLFISRFKHVTSSYNYEWDKTSPQHSTMHEKMAFIKLFYLYSINIGTTTHNQI